MKKYRIADAHCHIFPPKIAEKAVASIGSFYDIPMTGGAGLAEELLLSGAEIGVEKYLVCSTATVPSQVESINSFIADCCSRHPELLGFATLHPDYEGAAQELVRVKALGLRGVKLHPDFQRFNIDDPKAVEMYRHIEAQGLAVLFHTGDARYDYSSPQRLGRVAQLMPGLTCIGAHFGGYSRWDDAERYLGQPNVYYDTSSALFELSPERATGLIRKFGSDRFFFGTDYPMWQHGEELERFMALPLTESEREDVLWNNFARLFGLV